MIVILGLLAFQPILVAVFLDDQVVGGLNSVLLLKLDQSSGLVHVVGYSGHEMTEDAVFLCQRNGESPGIVVFGSQRHLEIVKFSRGKIGHDGRIIVNPCDALLIAKRLLGFGITGESNDLGSVTVGNDLVVKCALFSANRLAAEVFPGTQAESLGDMIFVPDV